MAAETLQAPVGRVGLGATHCCLFSACVEEVKRTLADLTTLGSKTDGPLAGWLVCAWGWTKGATSIIRKRVQRTCCTWRMGSECIAGHAKRTCIVVKRKQSRSKKNGNRCLLIADPSVVLRFSALLLHKILLHLLPKGSGRHVVCGHVLGF